METYNIEPIRFAKGIQLKERARILEIIDKCVVKWDKAKIVYVEELKKEIENGD